MTVQMRSAVRFGIAAALLIALFALAQARTPPGTDLNSPVHKWFHEQHSVTGIWCCDVADGHLLADDQWRTGLSSYQVKIADHWLKVPKDALRDPKGGPNPTESAIVWYTVSTTGAVQIYCFAPGAEY